MSQTIHICTAYDKKYINPARAMLGSLIYNLNSDINVEIHILTCRDILPQEHYMPKKNGNVVINFYEVDIHKHNLISPTGHITNTTYFRLLISQFLPSNIKKIIYLDPDTIVIDSITKLFNHSIPDDCIIKAVEDPVTFDLIRTKHTMKNYFNAGVMLIDYTKWCDYDVYGKSFKVIKNYPEKITFWDQDALNIVLDKKWSPLKPKWNVIPYFFMDNWQLSNEIKDSSKQPSIVHFSSDDKPWHKKNKNPYKNDFFFYKNQYTITI